MSRRVEVPLFEFVGPPCGGECPGVLIDCIDTKTNEWFHKCWKCNRECDRVSAQDKLNWAVRTIERTLKGEKLS